VINAAANAARSALTLLCLLGAASAPAQTPTLLDLASFPRATLEIVSATGTKHTFDVRIADTPARQQQGLMFVRDLPASEGMIFMNREPRVVGMWMKNTYIPLDMLFIDARNRVVAIFTRTTPHSLETITHPRPVASVLEIRGGEAQRLGIKVGARVRVRRSGR
jgi:uncharacterized membrane protein (UPF0127 family)